MNSKVQFTFSTRIWTIPDPLVQLYYESGCDWDQWVYIPKVRTWIYHIMDLEKRAEDPT